MFFKERDVEDDDDEDYRRMLERFNIYQQVNQITNKGKQSAQNSSAQDELEYLYADDVEL